MASIPTSILQKLSDLTDVVSKSWKSSKYFRIVSIVTGSIVTGLTARNVYIHLNRKYNNVPSGPAGLPLIGNIVDIFNPNWLNTTMASYGCICSIMMGPKNCIIINDPYLAKSVYSSTKMLDTSQLVESDAAFVLMNGKGWADRRRMISANLMSTMKATYVQDATKSFMKHKICTIFDKDIKENKPTNVRDLFRALGFNITLQACFGQELASFDDPFWQKFDKKMKNLAAIQFVQTLILLSVPNKRLSDYLQKALTGSTILTALNPLIDDVEEFANDQSKHIEQIDKDENVKLFNDYINDYTNNTQSKWQKKHLIGDMMLMMAAATDTTYAALVYCLLLAAKYPNIQEDIYKELINAFHGNIDEIDLRIEGIIKIPQLRALIRESLRIFPPAPMAGFRQMNYDGFTIDATKYGRKIYNVPKKSYVAVNISTVGRDPKYWIKNYDQMNNDKNVNMEKPHLEFWLDDKGMFNAQQNSALFLAFSLGRRDCVGQALAMKQLMVVLAVIFMKYKVTHPNGKTEFEIKSTLKSVMEPIINEVRFQHRV